MPKQPQAALDGVFAFSPNRDTLGATAYFIVEKDANILIDCPAFEAVNLEFLQQQGGVRWLVITHRGAIGKAEKVAQALGCEIIIQEQEAYLLPETPVTSFSEQLTLTPNAQILWTPGHSPGSACFYWSGHGGILFTGRHLIPNLQGVPVPLRTSKTFHWPRQLRSIQFLRDRFTSETLHYLCPGANTGFLRGAKVIDHAYKHLMNLDLEACRQAEVMSF
jgi:glyoxylase-like metal-dependent hydrolase (beta-lactamase superfamily II)